MGRRRPQNVFPRQESSDEKKLQHRQKHKLNSNKHNASPHSAPGTPESKSHSLPPAGREDRTELQAPPSARNRRRSEPKPTAFRGRPAPAIPRHRLTDSCPDHPDGPSPAPEVGSLSAHGESDGDTDLSESERLPVSGPGRVPPQLELRPEVVKAEDPSRGPGGRRRGGFDFPDFLPPPFNSWSLGQLAAFYSTEGRGASRPGPMGPLERYLERLLQLEWHQIQTRQEESGKSDAASSCRRSPAAASTRLSSPKSILQCQRAFPLTFLSSLAGHSALLGGCAHVHARQSRPSPLMEHRGPSSLPKRSYSESRVHSWDSRSTSQTQRLCSPVRTHSHLRRMQASGNIRSLVQGAAAEPNAAARDGGVEVARDRVPARGGALDCRTVGSRRRSGSEQRRGRLERRGASEKRQGGSECRGGGAERRRTAEREEQEIKPDAVTAIMDNLPGFKNAHLNRPNKVKQVEFVT